MNIRDFPLAWRWTDSKYTVLPDDVLSQLQPLSVDEARCAFEQALRFQSTSERSHSADLSNEAGCAWLRSRHQGLEDLVTIVWSRDCVLRTPWKIFTEYWSDFCYPASDEVTVWPDSGGWVLFFHHYEQFEFSKASLE